MTLCINRMLCVMRYIYSIVNPQRMCTRHGYNRHRRLLRSLASFQQMKPKTVASFQLEGKGSYVW